MASDETDLAKIEGKGALNFLAIFNPLLYCHRPIIVRDKKTTLGEIIPKLKVHPERYDDDVIDKDIIIFWGSHMPIITGSDILGRLMRGIVQNEGADFRKVISKQA